MPNENEISKDLKHTELLQENLFRITLITTVFPTLNLLFKEDFCMNT